MGSRGQEIDESEFSRVGAQPWDDSPAGRSLEKKSSFSAVTHSTSLLSPTHIFPSPRGTLSPNMSTLSPGSPPAGSWQTYLDLSLCSIPSPTGILIWVPDVRHQTLLIFPSSLATLALTTLWWWNLDLILHYHFLRPDLPSKVGAGGLEVQGHSWLQKETEVSQGHIRSHLRKERESLEKQGPVDKFLKGY